MKNSHLVDAYWAALFKSYESGELSKVAREIDRLGGLGKAAGAWVDWTASKMDWSKGSVSSECGLAKLFTEVAPTPLPPMWRSQHATFFSAPGVA